MTRDRAYERKISSEEAQESYILVSKDRLGWFPPVGQEFDLVDDGSRRRATVEAYDCECRGPQKPHQHYFIRRADLSARSRVKLTKEGSDYRLEILPPGP